MTPTAYMEKQSVSRLREISHDERLDYEIRAYAEVELLRRIGGAGLGKKDIHSRRLGQASGTTGETD
ncbi:hypothetical protein P4H71_06825 [Paenibacillus kribbensis]|uniref:hypothetical protein n=1 Tax=Paenibacillus kribbensis TaxID=172713 RepID=UPI002DB9239B|nr:hypothetical protein [Paenibacillus kribbensis]MEC0234043.1 hypothetical protein [Paenibacillus kribbensis]